MYRCVNADVYGPTLAIHQVYESMVSAADAIDRKSVLEGIASRVTLKISPAIVTLLYATGIE
jgi:hypothetical protein